MKIALGIIVLLLLGAAGYYFISPFFNTVVVDDQLPEEISDVREGAETTETEEINADELNVMNEDMPEADTQSAPTSFPIVGTTGHPAEGTARVLDTADGQVIRFENFSTINGPQLHVYLAKDLDANNFIDLGPIRGTEGNINYTVPDGVDLSEYRYVMHWCVPFGVLFNYADITK